MESKSIPHTRGFDGTGSPTQYQYGGLQFMAGAHGVSMGTTTVNSAGRDIIVMTMASPLDAEKQEWRRKGETRGHVGPDTLKVSADEISRWLGGPSFLKIVKTALEHRTANTGNWFLHSQEFRELVEGNGVVLWGKGMPGAGKTVLSSTSAEHLQNTFRDRRDIAITCAFLRYSEKWTAREIFTSLLGQLIKAHDGACDYVRVVYSSCNAVDNELTVKEITQLLRKVIAFFAKVFIILDGLDEAGDEVREGILQALPPMGANLLITSRPLDHLLCYTPGALQVTIEARTEDIGLFVEEQVKQSARLQAIMGGDSELINQLSGRINEKSKGMFLVAHLQMESLMRRAHSINSVLKGVDNLPSGVDDLYNQALVRIGSQPQEDGLLAMKAFLWLANSLRRLSTTELQHALMFSYDTLSFDVGHTIPIPLLVSMCGGLVIQETRSTSLQTLEFIHYTAQEYMKSIKDPRLPDADTLISVTCIACLEQHYEELQKCREREALSLYIASHPFLSYAFDNWGDHARAAQRHGPLHPYVISFLSKANCFPTFDPFFPERIYMTSGLHLAVTNGLSSVIASRTLPPALKSNDLYGYSPFHLAVAFGRVGTLRTLLESYKGVNVQTKAKSSPLHTAVLHARTLVAKELLAFLGTCDGVLDVNLRNFLGETALTFACREGLSEIIRLILSRKDVDVHAKARHGQSAFFWACGCLHRIRLQASINDPNLEDCRKDKEGNIAKLLVSSAPNLDLQAPNETGITPFMNACRAGSVQLVSWLLERIPDAAHQVDYHGMTALLWAAASVCKGTREVMEILLQADPKVDLNKCNSKGQTALILAACLDDTEKVRFLLSHPGVDYNAQDKSGSTALIHACTRKNAGTIKAFLSSDADVDVYLRDNAGLSALDYITAPRETILRAPLGGIPEALHLDRILSVNTRFLKQTKEKWANWVIT
ncbi:hypothetical protein D9611_007384 [Ephemerocybe angulata]|uniref:Nephrocystin 3-like N-terminal domain-containing protein n=1 Tax=Ephemerocybe angulata TaxID=980116 RepID=A0A8H5CHD3_9AGAR|nr:hypothetical protein D9611_007384 [Tulosesus angulatus]